jgi:hypothetical protein
VNKEEKLSEMILSYLRRHPDAGDTLEGITKWWLELERIDTSVDDVASVVNNLAKRRILKTHKTQCGTKFYKISDDYFFEFGFHLVDNG